MEKLGEGTYGLVYKVQDVATQLIYALKQIKMEEKNEGIPSTCLREIAILKMLKCPNIVRYAFAYLLTEDCTR